MRFDIKLVFMFFLSISFETYCNDIDRRDFKGYLDVINSYQWDRKKTDQACIKKGLLIVERINGLIDEINSSPWMLRPEKLRKSSNGCLITENGAHLYLDYSELFADTFNCLVYHDDSEKILMVLKNGKYLYFVDGSDEKNEHFMLKLNPLLFESEDFNIGGYTVEALKKAIDGYFFTSSIIQKSTVESVYAAGDISWLKYFINPGNDRMMFKPGIEFDLKYEIPVTFILRPKPAKLYPVWLKYTRKFDSSPQSERYFNELITIPNFYEVWRERIENWIKDGTKTVLNEKTKKLIAATHGYREGYLDGFEKENCFNLSKKNIVTAEISGGIDEDIITLNRMLLQDTFPELCPNMCRLKFVPEIFAGDIDEYIDEDSIKLLLEHDMSSGFFLEKNDAIKGIMDENQAYEDRDMIRYGASLKLKKLFSQTELMAYVISCGGSPAFENEKYLDIADIKSAVTEKIVLSSMKTGVAAKKVDYKKTVKMKHYHDALKDHFEGKKSGTVYKFIFGRTRSDISKIFDFYDGVILIDGKCHDAARIDVLTEALLKLQYDHTIGNPEVKKLLESENWELPVIFIKIDDKLFTSYFLDYEKKENLIKH